VFVLFFPFFYFCVSSCVVVCCYLVSWLSLAIARLSHGTQNHETKLNLAMARNPLPKPDMQVSVTLAYAHCKEMMKSSDREVNIIHLSVDCP